MKNFLFSLIFLPCFLFGYNKIISLAPSITETLFFVGAGKQVVGVTKFCKYPEEVLKKEKIGGYLDLNYEKIISISPDLVLCLDSDINTKKKLEELNIKVEMITQKTLSDIQNSIIKIGKLTGHYKEAKKKQKEIEKFLKKSRYNKKNKSLLLIIGRSSGNLNNVYIAGNTGFYDEIINKAGFKNAYNSSVKIYYPSVNAEGIISMNPDYIVELVKDKKEKKKKINDWNKLLFLDAVKNKKIFYIIKDYSTIPGPRIFYLIKDLQEIK